MTAETGDRDRSRPPRSPAARAALAVALAVVFAGLVALGTWQLFRLRWKLDLIARVDRRVHAAPVAPPPPADWAHVTASRDAYRHVQVSGTFLNAKQTFVQAVTGDGPGFWVVTPLDTKSDGIVLVNRGFVPTEARASAESPSGEERGPVTVTGLLRVTEPMGAFLRRNDSAADRWFSRDVAAIARARGLADVAPYFIDADASHNGPTEPVGGLTVVSFPNNHLVYALTWYAMAVFVAVAGIRALREDGSPSTDPEA